MSNVTIDFSKPLQQIDGFGVHGAFHQARNLRLYPQADRDRMLDVLFATQNDGAGFSIIRNIVGDSGVWGNEKDGPIPSIEPEKGTINLDGDEDQLWFMREAKKRGCGRFVSTVWSPPAWMKTNGDVANGGSLKAACYTDFAEYLARYVKLYKREHGIDIYAISPSNEPDFRTLYSSCLWSGDQFADFYKNYLAPVFKREHIEAKTFAPETTLFGNARLSLYESFLLDREASAALDIVAQHGYPGGTIEKLDEKYVQGRKVWMTEVCELNNEEDGIALNPSIRDGVKVAAEVHRYLTRADVSAFIYFWGVSMYDERNGGVIALHLKDMTYTVCKRAYTIGNFSRFVRPGSHRVKVSGGDLGGLLVSAYKGADGDAIIVAINQSEESRRLALSFEGGAPMELSAYVTNEDKNIALKGSVYPVPGGKADVSVGPMSVVTFRGAMKH